MVIKYPGEGGELAQDPNFHSKCQSLLQSDGFVIVRKARKPVETRQLKKIFQTDNTSPGSNLFVSADDWAVYKFHRHV